MSTIGLLGLLIAFAGVAVSVVCLGVGQLIVRKNRDSSTAETLLWGGYVAVFLTIIALTVCCGLLVYCFMTGDTSIEYVVENQSDATGALGVLYRLSGLWGGREGSLLFWAWLISAFNGVVAARGIKRLDALDNMALLVSQLVLAAFVGVLLFSESNMPFTAMSSIYFDSNGDLTNGAQVWGMNSLLEHWAMAIHPPTLFIGYAGLTIPFAYAIAALIVNDSSARWVQRCTRYAVFSWLFLGIGIGLGAVWAYVVLGWGGYWGWDPVENASLLSWLVGLALIHSFTVYRQRGGFKRWSIMCTCLTFAFVIVGTFITRSGLVESVHAFEGDPVSLVLFLSLIVLSVLLGIAGLAWRWKSFSVTENSADEIESMLSKEAAYYFNNVIMVIFAFLLAYMTISSALPEWLPFGGQSLSSGTYNTIARPLGIAYCAILAVCPLLSWGRTEGALFWKRARVPGVCALVLFAALMAYFVLYLFPSYNAIVEGGGTAASDLTVYGPSWYYNGLTVVGFAVASLLFFNSLFMLGRGARAKKKASGGNVVVAFFTMLRNHASTYGGVIAHLSMAIILVGLIGSAMYVTEEADYLSYDEEIDGTTEEFTIQDFTLVYTNNSVTELENGTDILYTVEFDVYRSGEYVGHVTPTVQLDASTQQQKLVASVISFPLEDLFVVYKGVNTDGDYAIDVRVNPCISFVWLGFGLMMLGIVIALVGRRGSARGGRVAEAELPKTELPKAAEAEVAEAALAAEVAESDDASVAEAQDAPTSSTDVCEEPRA